MGFMNYSHSMLTPWMKGWTTMGDFELIVAISQVYRSGDPDKGHRVGLGD